MKVSRLILSKMRSLLMKNLNQIKNYISLLPLDITIKGLGNLQRLAGMLNLLKKEENYNF